MDTSGIKRCCPICSLEFVVCEGCWRGHRYCSAECSTEAKRRKHRVASRRYDQSPRGQRNHRRRQAVYRGRQKSVALRTCSEKKVTDATSLGSSRAVNLRPPRCFFCATLVLNLMTEKEVYELLLERRKRERDPASPMHFSFTRIRPT